MRVICAKMYMMDLDSLALAKEKQMFPLNNSNCLAAWGLEDVQLLSACKQMISESPSAEAMARSLNQEAFRTT